MNIHSQQRKRNYASEQVDGIAVQHRLNHVYIIHTHKDYPGKITVSKSS